MRYMIICLLLTFSLGSQAQQFIHEGQIEYEMRVNNHKTFGDGIFSEMFKDKIPQFSTYYYTLSFSDNKGLYKFKSQDEKGKLPWGDQNLDDNIWFSDYNSGNFIDQKFVFDDVYLLSDSMMKIDWKLVPNETREIAGFNCRKAVGKIFDSVYVFAFYTDEITVSGGPMGIHGLPGMILGITVPRMYTSWIATKLQLNGFDPKEIKAPTKGKKKKATELRLNVEKVAKDWGSWGQQSVWNIFL